MGLCLQKCQNIIYFHEIFNNIALLCFAFNSKGLNVFETLYHTVGTKTKKERKPSSQDIPGL